MEEVTVVLIGYAGDAWLPACVESLAHASEHRLHLVVVDNAENTVLNGLDYSAFRQETIELPNPMGFAQANNYALVHASRLERYVLFLNQDTIGERGWIDRCLESFRADSTMGALSPALRTYDNAGWDPAFADCLPAFVEGRQESAGPTTPSERVPATALLVRTDVLLRAGPFDPVFGSYYEDYDLCARIQSAGFVTAFRTDAVVRHFSGSATNTAERQRRRMRQVLRNRLLFRLRERRTWRSMGFLHHLILDLPRRLARGCLRRDGSQPPGVVVAAEVDIFRELGRMVSAAHDRRLWLAYLESIGWPDSVRTR